MVQCSPCCSSLEISLDHIDRHRRGYTLNRCTALDRHEPPSSIRSSKIGRPRHEHAAAPARKLPEIVQVR